MQDPTTTTTLHNPMYMKQQQPQLFPEQEVQQQQQLKCPRCDSSNTKFCYYNNYNLSQPRHFCKNCRRYWTKGGALRNIPIGGGTRKSTTKRSSPSSPSSSSTPSKKSNLSSKLPSPPSVPAQPDPNLKDPDPGFPDPTRFDGKGVTFGGNGSGSFSSLLASTVQWGGLWEGSGMRMMQMNNNGFGENNVVRNMDSGIGNGNSEGILGNKQNGDSSCWSNGDSGGGGVGTNGWSDLAIYTPGSSYQ